MILSAPNASIASFSVGVSISPGYTGPQNYRRHETILERRCYIELIPILYRTAPWFAQMSFVDIHLQTSFLQNWSTGHNNLRYAALIDPRLGYLTGADILCDGGCIAGGTSAIKR